MDDTEEPFVALGEAVRLTKDGPEMKVIAIDGNSATCGWFEKGVFRERGFPIVALKSGADYFDRYELDRLDAKEVEALVRLLDKMRKPKTS